MFRRDHAALLAEIAFGEDRPAVRPDAISGLGRIGAVEHGDAILACLEEDDVEIRAAAVSALGDLRLAGHAGRIAALVTNEHQVVRYQAIVALGKVGGAAAVERLAALLETDDPAEVGIVLDAVRLAAERTLSSRVAEVLGRDHVYGRGQAIQVLEDLGAADEAPALLRALESPQRPLALEAARALCRLEVREALEPLARLLGSNDPGIRATSARHLAELAARTLTPAQLESWEAGLEPLRADPCQRVRIAARIGLVRVAPDRAGDARAALEEILSIRRRHGRSAWLEELLDALASRRDPRAYEAYARAVVIDREIDGREDLERLFEARGLRLVTPPDARFEGCWPAGLHASPRTLLEGCSRSSSPAPIPVLDRGQVRFFPLEEAIRRVREHLREEDE